MNNFIRSLIDKLPADYDPDEAKHVALLILQHVTKQSRVQLLTDAPALGEQQQAYLNQCVERLCRHEPVQYVIGETDFFGLTMEVDRRVLIPRPETEELVAWLLSENGNEKKAFLDICTGSGCIAVALAKNRVGAHVMACDISPDALAVAQNNARRNGVHIHFFQADALVRDFAEKLPPVDVMVSNPPYVLENEKEAMKPDVFDFEPSIALFVPDADPLLFYRAIGNIALKKLKPRGALYLEINRAYGNEIVRLLTQTGFDNVQLRNDLSGNPRMIKAEKSRGGAQL